MKLTEKSLLERVGWVIAFTDSLAGRGGVDKGRNLKILVTLKRLWGKLTAICHAGFKAHVLHLMEPTGWLRRDFLSTAALVLSLMMRGMLHFARWLLGIYGVSLLLEAYCCARDS